MRRLLYICNALDDETRLQRGIHTDSPAASRKILATCAALRNAGVRATVLSTGRGRADSSWRYFPAAVRRVQGMPVIYMPFTHVRIVSELISLFALAWFAFKLNRRKGEKTFLFYNRTVAYTATIMVAALLHVRRVLDLEDGYIRPPRWTPAWGLTCLKAWLFDGLSNGGVLLANSALGQQTALQPRLCFYGVADVADIAAQPRDWRSGRINLLLGGTVAEDTGAKGLIEAIERLRDDAVIWGEKLTFFISGKGDCIDAFRRLEGGRSGPQVHVMGRLTDDEYDRLLQRCHVGLALKQNRGALADTTFPSKVVEMAGAGLLVVTTRISDVDKVLRDGAIYVESDDSGALLDALRQVAEAPVRAEQIAEIGTAEVARLCDVREAGRTLAEFLFPAPR